MDTTTPVLIANLDESGDLLPAERDMTTDEMIVELYHVLRPFFPVLRGEVPLTDLLPPQLAAMLGAFK